MPTQEQPRLTRCVTSRLAHSGGKALEQGLKSICAPVGSDFTTSLKDLLPTPQSDTDSRPLLGLGVVLVTVFFFAVSDILTKQLTTRYPVSLVVAVRYLSSLLLLLLFVWPRMKRRLWQTTRTRLVLLRGLVLALCSLTLGLGLRLMPVGETIAIVYLFPILVMITAVPLLGERVSPLGWLFALLGFSGVLFIIRPGSGLDLMGVIYTLLNALLATVYHLITRVLTKTETHISLLFHVTLIGAVFFCVSAIPSLEEPLPKLTDLGLMSLLGGISTAGHFLFTVAYRYAPASLIAPANYMHLVWASLLGWVFFSHFPDQWTLLGMLMIITAGAGIAIKSHLEKVRSRSAVIT